MNQPRRIKQAVVAFVAALLLALSILGAGAYADSRADTGSCEVSWKYQPCWWCG